MMDVVVGQSHLDKGVRSFKLWEIGERRRRSLFLSCVVDIHSTEIVVSPENNIRNQNNEICYVNRNICSANSLFSIFVHFY